MRTAETILNEKLEMGKTLDYVITLATALERPDLKDLALSKKTAEPKTEVKAA
jgi:hypothetical protein